MFDAEMRTRIKDRMDSLGVSQSDLARGVGITQGAVNQILSGTTKRSKFLPEIANYLGMDWKALTSGPGGKPRHAGGRPRHDPNGIKNGTVNMRLHPVLKALLYAAAEESGRAIAAEVELRLMRTFPEAIEQHLLTLEVDEAKLAQRLAVVRQAKHEIASAIDARSVSVGKVAYDAKSIAIGEAMDAAKVSA